MYKLYQTRYILNSRSWLGWSLNDAPMDCFFLIVKSEKSMWNCEKLKLFIFFLALQERKTFKAEKNKTKWWKSLKFPALNGSTCQCRAQTGTCVTQAAKKNPWTSESRSLSARLLGCWLADSLACQKINWQSLSALTSVRMNHFQSLSKRKTYSNVLCRDYSTFSRLWSSFHSSFNPFVLPSWTWDARSQTRPPAALRRLFYPEKRQRLTQVVSSSP